jgi:hypothetical protein
MIFFTMNAVSVEKMKRLQRSSNKICVMNRKQRLKSETKHGFLQMIEVINLVSFVHKESRNPQKWKQ